MFQIALNENSKDIKAALETSGCFYVKFPSDSAVWKSAKLLWEQEELNVVQRGGFVRGYLGKYTESGSTKREEKEGFAYGFGGQMANPLSGENAWPLNFDHASLDALFFEACSLARQLTSIISELYTGSPHTWLDLCKDGDSISIMRIFHYFARDDNKSLGSSPHTDWGFLTLIKCQETLPGLQLAQKGSDGNIEWKNVPAAPPGEDPNDWWICNAGDFLSLMTSGQILSPLHRVISTTEERTSFVFFAYPSFECPVPDVNIENGELSLFSNQSEKGSAIGGKLLVTTHKSFGSFIHEKWHSVARY